MIRFSVIIPVFRVENYLRQCVDSVLNQTFNNFEIILVDDGSPDNSPAICDEYVQKDKRVHVIHKINGGLSSARNAGLTVAQGEYVLFLDSDDWWDDLEALAKIDIKLKGANTDILIIGLKKFFMQQNKISNIRVPKIQSEEKSHEPFDVQIKKYMQNNTFVACACDKVVRRTFIERQKLNFVQGQLSEDIEWCVKLLLMNPTIDVLEESFYVYRQGNTSSITSNINKRNVLHVYSTIEKYAKRDSPEPVKHYLANQYVLLLAFSNKVPYKEISELIPNFKKHWWLIDYNWYPYVHKVSILKWLGMKNIRKLLGIYLKYKQNL